MLKNRSLTLFVLSSVLLGACFGPVAPGGLPPALDQNNSGQQWVAGQGQNQPAQNTVQFSATQASPIQETVSTEANVIQSDAPHHSDVDVTHLEVGDGKYSTSPQVGYVYTCQTQFGGAGGAGSPGNWLNGDGTWDATKKAVVDGSITWPGSFSISVQGDQRVFTGNDLPDHPTGSFPISSSDDAYKYDRNPNSIKQQSITLSLPANPVAAAQPICIGGEVGIMLSGVVIFSAFDAEGRDAPAHEVQDGCNGHPQNTGFYHYHSLSDCIQDNASGHSALMGYSFDGYGIYGYYGEDGKELTDADLDECHGHTHMIEWNGQMVMMYHYHATHEFPYVVGCFHGTPAVRALSAGSGQGQPSTGSQTQPASQNGAQGSNGQQPPQEAIDACNRLTQSASCSVNTPNGTITGICKTPPNLSQLVCVPQGGPP